MADEDVSAAELHALLSVAEQSVRQTIGLAPATRAALATRLERLHTQLVAPGYFAAAGRVPATANPYGAVWRPVVGSDRFAGLILLPPTEGWQPVVGSDQYSGLILLPPNAPPPPKLETCIKCYGQRVAGSGI